MKKLKKGIYLVLCITMLSQSAGVLSYANTMGANNAEVIKVVSSFVPLDQNNENEEITLSPFMVFGMQLGKLQNVPERIQEKIDEADITNIPEIKITRKEASQITGKLFADDLMPIMFTGTELNKYVLVGVDQIMYFTNIDMANIFDYAFSKEQMNALFPCIMKYFMPKSIEELKKALPHMDLDVILSPTNEYGLILGPYWESFKNLASQELDKAEKEMKDKVNNADIPKEEKEKLLKSIDDITEKQKAKWNKQSAYYINNDLRNMVYTPNNLYKAELDKLDELTKKEDKLEDKKEDVNKVDDKKEDKKDKPKNTDKKDSSKSDTNKSVSNVDNNVVYRLHGNNRYETAISISQNSFKSADTVVLVNPLKPSDCLTSSVYANLIGAPLLFTDTDKLPNKTLKEIERLNAKNVIIIGGIHSINDGIIPSKFNVERVSGNDRYATSVEIANNLNKKLHVNADSFVLASGEIFSDALSIAPKAIKDKSPILLTKAESLSETVKSKIKNEANHIDIVGGDNTIFKSVKDEVKSYVKHTSILSGSNRYETAINIAKKFYLESTKAIVVNGHSFSDALVSSYVDSNKGSIPILLTNGNNLTKETGDYIKSSKIRKEIVVGGSKSISDRVLEQLKKIFK